MSTVTVDESFELGAAPGVVWGYLIDPARIVVCLPGAELLSVDAEGIYHGRVRVKLGAVTLNFDGTMEFATIDTDQRRVEMLGKGRDKGGSGSASMKMEGRVEETDGAGSRVHITADVQLTGKIVRFGSGMIGAVSREVFSQFATCLGELVPASADQTLEGAGIDATEAVTPDRSGRGPSASADAVNQAAPVSAFGLLFSALRSSIRRFLDRVFRRQ